ncbi:hypothetical protein EZV62_019584 [Acer yangbiense]|uniref:SWIM-type domain-containing protein n=1 Tax=Acer yangbiense TaxID=1000413 RepID=A0A5C7HBV3_9ROSI|nr:hypothetical protein EZV62_019584 [Acer yangbiense]
MESGAMDSFTFKKFVQTGVNLVEVGGCDVYHISLITLIHAIYEKLRGSSYVPARDYHVWAQIPCMFEERGLDKIVFELEDYFYIPTPPEEPQVLDMEGVRTTRVYNNKETKVKWIAFKFEKLVKSNPSIDVKVIGDLLRENYKMPVDMHKLYKAKHRSLNELAKEHANCFGYLRRYAYVLNQSNHGVAVHICTQQPQPIFQRIFLSFEPQKVGFLKGIVQACKAYLCQFQADLQRFAYDPVIRCDHVTNNMTEAFNSKLGIVQACKAYLCQFQTDLQRFAYDPVIRCDHVTNNMTEAFNSKLGTHRAASYLDLLEFIRRMVMRKFNERKEVCRGWSSVLPPKVHAKILRHGRESRSLTMIAARNMEYELLGASGGYAMKLRKYNCQCGSWQMSGIPCCHVMAAISHYCGREALKDKVVEFVHSNLTKSAYMQTYVGMIHPIPDQKRWPEVPACILILGHVEHMNPPPRTV